MPSDTEDGAKNLIASCEQYLDENEAAFSEAVLDKQPVIINPFADVKMYPKPHEAVTFGLHEKKATGSISTGNEEDQQRKLSSVSDIRDSIRETHEEASSPYFANKTIPRAFHSKRPKKPSAASAFDFKGLPRQDGTESVKSFVIVSNSTLNLTDDQEEDGEEWSYDDDLSEGPGAEPKRSFVNKCVNRVKSLVQPRTS